MSHPNQFRFLFFDILIPENQNKEKPFIQLRVRRSTFNIEMGSSPDGNLRRIINYIQKFDTIVENIKKNIEELEMKISETERYLNEGSDLSRRVVELEKEREEIFGLIRYSEMFEQEPEVTWRD